MCKCLWWKGWSTRKQEPCSHSQRLSFAGWLLPQLFWSQLKELFLPRFVIQQLSHAKRFSNCNNNQHPELLSSTLERILLSQAPSFDALSQRLLSCLLHDHIRRAGDAPTQALPFGDRRSEPLWYEGHIFQSGNFFFLSLFFLSFKLFLFFNCP